MREELDANPAAWCAIELAILDVLAKRPATRSMEACCRCRRWPAGFTYTAVLGDA